jgi:hypothetical protein
LGKRLRNLKTKNMTKHSAILIALLTVATFATSRVFAGDGNKRQNSGSAIAVTAGDQGNAPSDKPIFLTKETFLKNIWDSMSFS